MRKRSVITHPVAGNLPEELMMEIIVRIPVRFLMRLRFVCKSWNALITDPQFALELVDCNKNTQQNIMFPGFRPHIKSCYHKYVALFRLSEQPRILYDLYLIPGCGPDFPQNLNFADCFRKCDVSGSINGIICLSSIRRLNSRFVALWNPSIKYWKLIHLPNTVLRECNWFESIGLAFDSLANDYKVIRLVPLHRQMTNSSSATSRVEVYSAKQDSWSVVHSQIPFFTTQQNCSLIVKGVPYWSRNYDSYYPAYDRFQSNVIASFDPRTGLYKKISYPQILLNKKTSVHPFNLMDSLAILIYSPGEKPNQTFQVYALDDENSCGTTWNNIYSIATPTIQLHKFDRIFGCFEDPGKIVVGQNPHQNAAFLYDLKTDCVIESTELDAFRPMWNESYHHVESLVYIPGMEPIQTEDGNHVDSTESSPRSKTWTNALSSVCNFC